MKQTLKPQVLTTRPTPTKLLITNTNNLILFFLMMYLKREFLINFGSRLGLNDCKMKFRIVSDGRRSSCPPLLGVNFVFISSEHIALFDLSYEGGVLSNKWRRKDGGMRVESQRKLIAVQKKKFIRNHTQ